MYNRIEKLSEMRNRVLLETTSKEIKKLVVQYLRTHSFDDLVQLMSLDLTDDEYDDLFNTIGYVDVDLTNKIDCRMNGFLYNTLIKDRPQWLRVMPFYLVRRVIANYYYYSREKESRKPFERIVLDQLIQYHSVELDMLDNEQLYKQINFIYYIVEESKNNPTLDMLLTQYIDSINIKQQKIEDLNKCIKVYRTYLNTDEFKKDEGIHLRHLMERWGNQIFNLLEPLTTYEEVVMLVAGRLKEQKHNMNKVRVNKVIYIIYRKLGSFIVIEEEGVSEFTFINYLADIEFDLWKYGPIVRDQERLNDLLEEINDNDDETYPTPLLDKHPGIKQYLNKLIDELMELSDFTLVDHTLNDKETQTLVETVGWGEKVQYTDKLRVVLGQR